MKLFLIYLNNGLPLFYMGQLLVESIFNNPLLKVLIALFSVVLNQIGEIVGGSLGNYIEFFQLKCLKIFFMYLTNKLN